MAGPVGLAVGGPLVALGADEVTGLLLEEAVQRVLDGPPDELAKVGLQGLLVERYNVESYRGGPCPPSLPGRYSAVKVRKKLYVTVRGTVKILAHFPTAP